jgi:anti-anti-sigma factor
MLTEAPLTFEKRAGRSAGSIIISLCGPLTLRNLFDLQAALRQNPTTDLCILDLSSVPYMDSAGIGLVVNHFVHCQNHGGRMIVAGVCSRVMELFRLTHLDKVIPQASTVDDAEGQF